MIDLAMVAAGEVPMEVDRVSCLSSAVMGFSPLVFDLQPNSDFEELLKACEKVWENVANDRTVLNKWVSLTVTGSHFEISKRPMSHLSSVKKFFLIVFYACKSCFNKTQVKVKFILQGKI